MDFRIVETTPDAKYISMVEGASLIFPRDENWYLVQYKKDPSIFNLWHPFWHTIAFNAEEYYKYPHITKLSLKVSFVWYDYGKKIYGLDDAKKLLKLVKQKYKTISGKLNVVYEESTIKKMAKDDIQRIISDYQKLLEKK